jgi:NarL family two-component system response regulator LiaR
MGVCDFVASLPGYRVVAEAANARAALPMIEAARPDVVLMDIVLPGMDGIVATREILRRLPEARVIVLSAHKQARDVQDAIDAGAVGYVLKADPPEALMQALDHAVRGTFFAGPLLAGSMSALEPTRTKRDVLDVLSEREREIFRLAADCRTSPEIARELCLSRKTVDTHVNRINRKLGLRDRAQLVRLAVGIGLVHSIRGKTDDLS